MGCETFLPCKSQEMTRSKFLINNYMKDFKYYGLFLTEESKAEQETQFTVCEEAYNGLSDFLDEEGNFNVEGYINFCNSEADKTQNTEG